MGYRSDIVIGVHKSVLTYDLIKPVIPDILKEEDKEIYGECVYWYLRSWKWYDDYAEVIAVLKFFDDLALLQRNDITGQGKCLFGALRIGDDANDFTAWGAPDMFEIYIRTEIGYPGN